MQAQNLKLDATASYKIQNLLQKLLDQYCGIYLEIFHTVLADEKCNAKSLVWQKPHLDIG
jgi:hypothetical protein